VPKSLALKSIKHAFHLAIFSPKIMLYAVVCCELSRVLEFLFHISKERSIIPRNGMDRTEKYCFLFHIAPLFHFMSHIPLGTFHEQVYEFKNNINHLSLVRTHKLTPLLLHSLLKSLFIRLDEIVGLRTKRSPSELPPQIDARTPERSRPPLRKGYL